MKFKIRLLLDKWNEAEARKSRETAQAIWSAAEYEDYVNYKLYDVEHNDIVISGDTTHDNIFTIINVFLDGLRYAQAELDVTYWVIYTDGTKEQVEG